MTETPKSGVPQLLSSIMGAVVAALSLFRFMFRMGERAAGVSRRNASAALRQRAVAGPYLHQPQLTHGPEAAPALFSSNPLQGGLRRAHTRRDDRRPTAAEMPVNCDTDRPADVARVDQTAATDANGYNSHPLGRAVAGRGW